MKQSRVKQLIPKPLAKRIREAGDPLPPELQAVVDSESADVISMMESRGFTLAGRLDGGEGVFVRETEMVALHVHLPQDLYDAVAREADRVDAPKRRVVISALEEYLDLER